MFTPEELANARRQLLSARRFHRIFEEGWAEVQATAEERAIGSLGSIYGSNETERKRNLALVLAQDPDYQAAVEERERARFEVERLETEVTIMEDQRRAKEWEVRGNLVDALLTVNGVKIAPTLDGVPLPARFLTTDEVMAYAQVESEDHR